MKKCNSSINEGSDPTHKNSHVAIKELKKIRDSHQIWSNPLLLACASKSIDLNDFKHLFSQYYFYSKNFTKLLAIMMSKCDSDFYRAKLSANLWDEGGGADIEQRHSELFRKFLKQSLDIDTNNIKFEHYTEVFLNQYISLCLNSTAAECASILSFGTEGIVSKLYKILKEGLIQVGLNENELSFFNIHIMCDDDHSKTLEEMALTYNSEYLWFENSKKAINKALDLRDTFFTNIYESIQSNKLKQLIENINSKNNAGVNENRLLHYNLNEINNKLYSNKNIEKNINFKVDRVPFGADILDPRIVHIQKGFTNELHNHAHESIFLILSGIGEVIINELCIKIKPMDIIFVPRWVGHQTRNTGDEDLIFFAITDYGLTKRFPQNSETVYRMNKNSISR